MSIDTKYESTNPNKNYLSEYSLTYSGQDLFKTNNDLSDFAETVLRVSVSRAEKRSKYELIGLIVCEVTNLTDSNLTNLC